MTRPILLDLYCGAGGATVRAKLAEARARAFAAALLAAADAAEAANNA